MTFGLCVGDDPISHSAAPAGGSDARRRTNKKTAPRWKKHAATRDSCSESILSARCKVAEVLLLRMNLESRNFHSPLTHAKGSEETELQLCALVI